MLSLNEAGAYVSQTLTHYKPGDTIWIPPHEEHWHGASPHTMMVHLAIQEAFEGKTANWLEKVSDKDYHL